MAKYRHVRTTFWSDPKVTEEMTPEDRYFYLYLMTNEHTTQIGVYTITRKQMAFELGYSIESAKALLDRFTKHHELIVYNEETRELCILNWGKYNLIKGGKPVEDCIQKELKTIKDLSLVKLVLDRTTNESLVKKISIMVGIDDTHNDTYSDTSPLRGQKEKEKEKLQQEEKIPVAENLAIDFYMKNFGHISPFMGEEINQWLDDLNQSLVVEAMKITLENNKRNWSYTKGILKDWHQQGFKRIQDVEAAQAEFRRQQQSKKRTGKGYTKRTEAVPEWLHQREELEPIQQPQQVQSDDLEDNQKRLDEILSKYKNTKGE
ncbi:DnaD domain protein [Bacillus paramycoides]|uniref:DnaD domain protein n=1 Tax=Bacillus paramycoides TaxID=2026194 RepID=A0ABU6MNF8_9BACI|nr:DnaD domain protein [Bacillus paramycoides]MED1089715.1 DnaD domain protein [Bacillus paramycoides]MED1564401.1 DnaD domain protein [Bacillus paramycoides]